MRAVILLPLLLGCSLVRNADDIVVGGADANAEETIALDSSSDSAIDTIDAAEVAAPLDRRWAQWKMPSITPTGTSASMMVVHDLVTGVDWQQATGAPSSYADAVAACSALGTGWRLPFRVELVSLLALGETVRPTIDASAFPDTSITAPYWTASTLPSGGRYVVSFAEGTVDKALGTELNPHRCVRSP
jgi:hypothetical protein